MLCHNFQNKFKMSPGWFWQCLSSVQVLLVSGVSELQDLQNEQDAEQKVVKAHSR